MNILTPDEIAMLHRERLITKEEARRLLAHYGVTGVRSPGRRGGDMSDAQQPVMARDYIAMVEANATDRDRGLAQVMSGHRWDHPELDNDQLALIAAYELQRGGEMEDVVLRWGGNAVKA